MSASELPFFVANIFGKVRSLSAIDPRISSSFGITSENHETSFRQR
jgi:hypothetical protein